MRFAPPVCPHSVWRPAGRAVHEKPAPPVSRARSFARVSVTQLHMRNTHPRPLTLKSVTPLFRESDTTAQGLRSAHVSASRLAGVSSRLVNTTPVLKDI